ncbi:MAG: sulfate ABC transporter substrate-binding protein [Thermoguttaceae bacterium]|nr:sulfate ABC transporter substrate-binding protein [Thermoguttaceae bacterium]
MKRTKTMFVCGLFFLSAALPLLTGCGTGGSDGPARSFCNVSYDPTRELYKEYNELFAEHWLEKTGQTLDIEQSNAGSGAQSRAVRSGKEADVVTLALAFDIDDLAIEKDGNPGLLKPDWQKNFPYNSSPYISTIVILVRKGNPLGIHDWDDLARTGVKVVTPNPKTSGGARWNYLALWAYALDKSLADIGGIDKFAEADQERQAKAEEDAYNFTKQVFANAVNQGMPTGARDATDAFVKQGNGDAFLAWENEARLSQKVMADQGFEIVYPSITMRCEPPVAVVDAVVERRGTRDIAEEYLNYLYTPEMQEMIARHYYRPAVPEVAEKFADQFPPCRLVGIDECFGGWTAAQRKHFNADGLFDKMLTEIAQ